MTEQYRTEQTSEEISRWDAASYPGGINRYAEELRDAIERELREWGECPLLERLDRERPHISVPLFEVLQSVRRRQKFPWKGGQLWQDRSFLKALIVRSGTA